MKSIIFIRLFILTLITVTIGSQIPISALSGSDFKTGNIIDDSVFFNSGAMSEVDIQNFLNAKVPNCDTNGTKSYNGGSQSRAQYGTSKGYSAPYTCLKDYHQDTPSRNAETGLCSYYEGGQKSSARIIKDISSACGINPQVLLVLLQKEQSLVTDEWPWSKQYDKATGFACPDTPQGCDPAYAGFFYQVYAAARQYKKYQRDSGSYGYRAGRNNNIYYQADNLDTPNNEKEDCKYSSVYIENGATAGLYIYTPYQPNAASLGNLYGNGDTCSSYGNRNFWRLFSDWFGSTTGPAYNWKELSKKLYKNDQKKSEVDSAQLVQNQYIYAEVKVVNTGRVTWKQGKVAFATNNQRDRQSSFCSVEWTNPSECSRAGTLREDSVRPGETGTFEFWMRAPSTPNTYREYFNLVIDGEAWFSDIGFYWQMTVGNKTFPPARLSPDGKQELMRADEILSNSRQSSLGIDPSGNLALRVDQHQAWKAPTNQPARALVMQDDGNLVLYGMDGSALWGVNSSPGSNLRVQDDGTIGLYDSGGTLVWQTGTTAATKKLDYLRPGDIMHRGQTLLSTDNRYSFTLQDDGNLVLYGPSGGVWASRTNDGALLVQQSDGNLVLYNQFGRGVWGSNRDGANIYTYVQSDGNVVSYGSKGAIWGLR